jgi:hypothetical protein
VVPRAWPSGGAARKHSVGTSQIARALRRVGDIDAIVAENRATLFDGASVTSVRASGTASRPSSASAPSLSPSCGMEPTARGARRLHSLIDTFAAAVEVAPFEETAAAEFGRIGSVLAEHGTPIGEFDVLVAAHAVALRCVLVSNNTRHFSKVPGLLLENWT